MIQRKMGLPLSWASLRAAIRSVRQGIWRYLSSSGLGRMAATLASRLAVPCPISAAAMMVSMVELYAIICA
jgi:hypothetical protein